MQLTQTRHNCLIWDDAGDNTLLHTLVAASGSTSYETTSSPVHPPAAKRCPKSCSHPSRPPPPFLLRACLLQSAAATSTPQPCELRLESHARDPRPRSHQGHVRLDASERRRLRLSVWSAAEVSPRAGTRASQVGCEHVLSHVLSRVGARRAARDSPPSGSGQTRTHTHKTKRHSAHAPYAQHVHDAHTYLVSPHMQSLRAAGVRRRGWRRQQQKQKRYPLHVTACLCVSMCAVVFPCASQIRETPCMWFDVCVCVCLCVCVCVSVCVSVTKPNLVSVCIFARVCVQLRPATAVSVSCLPLQQRRRRKAGMSRH